MPTIFSVYRIVNFSNSKSYVGQTGNYPRRKVNHISMLRGKRHFSKKLQADFDNYGDAMFYFEILQTCESKEKADKTETYWINQLDSIASGYNTGAGGKAKGFCPIPQACEWNGIKYQSILDAAQANNLSEPAMRRRIIVMGYKNDADVKKGPGKIKQCAWNGVEYQSISDACKALGITPSTFYERIQKGYKSDSDLSKRPIPRVCKWNGIEYPTIKAMAKSLGLSIGTMRYRVDQGYTCDSDMVNCMKTTIVQSGQNPNAAKIAVRT